MDEPPVDPLSDVLHAVHLTGAVFFDIDARAPFVAAAPPSRTIAPHVLRGAEHAIEFHVVTAGACWGGLADGPPLRLEAGDVIAFPHGDAHVLSSAPGMRGPANHDIFEAVGFGRLPISVRQGPEGDAELRLVCGFVTCDRRPFNPLLAALPRVLHDRAARERGDRSSWISQFIEHAVSESRSRRPGSQTVLAKLSELMFLELVRRYLEALPAEHTGWLAALRDPIAGRAIALLHERPAHPWTVDELARAAGVSRSGLAERFTANVGLPPMQYLAQWRIQLAAGLLARTTAGIAAIASEVGYESEAAFHRAFKRAVGVAPGAWRRGKAP